MVLQYFTLGQTMQGPVAVGLVSHSPFSGCIWKKKKKLVCSLSQLRFKISMSDVCILLGDDNDDDNDDCFYITLFSALEQTHCAQGVFIMHCQKKNH